MHFDPSRIHVQPVVVGVLVWFVVMVLLLLLVGGRRDPMRGDRPADFGRWRTQWPGWGGAQYRDFLQDTWRHRNPGSTSAYALIVTLSALAVLLLALRQWGALTWGTAPEAGAGRGGWTGRCPDFAHTYDLAGSTLAPVLLQQPRPPATGARLRLTRLGNDLPQAWWVVPHDDVRVAAGLKFADCDGGWLLATVRPPVKDEGGAWRETEVWLAREVNGDLLVREKTYRVHQFSGWGGNAYRLRSTWATRQQRVPAVAGATDTDRSGVGAPIARPVSTPVPPVPAAVQVPAHAAEACPARAARVQAFVDRMRAALPAHVALLSAEAVHAPDCAMVTLNLNLQAATEQDLLLGEAAFKSDPEVKAVDLLYATPRSAGRARRLLQVHLR